jgi:hypothetical protein
MLGGILSGSCRRMLLLAAPPALLIGSGPWPADFSSELSPQRACDWRVAKRLFAWILGDWNWQFVVQQKGSGQGKEGSDCLWAAIRLGGVFKYWPPRTAPLSWRWRWESRELRHD